MVLRASLGVVLVRSSREMCSVYLDVFNQRHASDMSWLLVRNVGWLEQVCQSVLIDCCYAPKFGLRTQQITSPRPMGGHVSAHRFGLPPPIPLRLLWCFCLLRTWISLRISTIPYILSPSLSPRCLGYWGYVASESQSRTESLKLGWDSPRQNFTSGKLFSDIFTRHQTGRQNHVFSRLIFIIERLNT